MTEEFQEAWRDLKEKYLRRLVTRHLGVELGEFEDRNLVAKGSLVAAISETRRRNLLRVVWFKVMQTVRGK